MTVWTEMAAEIKKILDGAGFTAMGEYTSADSLLHSGEAIGFYGLKGYDVVDEGGTAICEFAAAAEVFYRFICLKAAEYKVMFTAQGKAVEAFDEENRIKAARELRDSAVSRAERFFSKDGFVFNAVIAY